MQTIKILIYTDIHNPAEPAKNITLEPADPFISAFGLSMMRDLILKNKRPLTDIQIDLINRNLPTPASQRITSELLSDYNQLWVFGYHQVNMPNYTATYGGPDNELKDEEVDALRCWMNDKRGGVLITGDHSEEDPRKGDNRPFLNLGRALGHLIPRAGQMRKWEGPPTNDTGLSYNTHTPTGAAELDEMRLQSDAEPQHIFLRLGEDRQPHELFRGDTTRKIQVFPDHMHEGELLTPCPVGDDWPAGSPTPEVVAWGADYRFFPPRFYPLVSVYDGHQVSVGRIVADSTWHHYLNINLRCLPARARCSCTPAAALDLIGQYYSNLVNWLSPAEARREMTLSILLHLATHLQVLEVRSSDPVTVGKAAIFVLEQKGLMNELDALAKTIIPEGFSLRQESALNISQELLIGSVIKNILEKERELGNAAEPESFRAAATEELVYGGVMNAFAIHLEQMQRQFIVLKDFYESMVEGGHVEDTEDGSDEPDE